jgi:hypothetical protein
MTFEEKVACYVKEMLEDGRIPEVVAPIGCEDAALRATVERLIRENGGG